MLKGQGNISHDTDVAAAAEYAAAMRGLADRIMFRNTFKVKHIRGGKVIGEYEMLNGIVDVGLHYLLDTSFRATTQLTSWFLGIVDNSGFSAFAAADTTASHAGWTEFTAYSEGTRGAWTPPAAATRTLSNTTTVDFTMSGGGTLKGLFLASDNTKGGTTGTLWATAAFAASVAVLASDIVRATYSITG